jgi:mxaJ protein
MSSPCRISLFALALFVASVVAFTPARAAAPFRICAEPDNPPMSQKATDSGYEIEVARLLAKEMGRPLEIKWVPQLDRSYFRETIDAGLCDAIMGVPAGFQRLSLTRPWYRTGFVFVTGKDHFSPKTFDDAALKTARIGVPATGLGDTPPIIALTRRGLEKNLRPYSIFQQGKIVSAVAAGRIDVGVVWGPLAGWFADKEKEQLDLRPTPKRDMDTPLAFEIAVGVRKDDRLLKNRLNAAIEQRQPDIDAVLRRWHVPAEKG